MNAEIAGELIAPFIDKRWPNDRKKVWEVLRLGINKAWQEGKWLGMTAEFYVPIKTGRDGQKYIITPQSHPILLAINGLNQSISIRDKYFMFHRNGYGDVRNSPSCNWNTDVYDLGATSYFDESNVDFASGVKVGVRPIGKAGTNEFVNINGLYTDGERVFTYQSTELGKTCGCTVKSDDIDTVNGVKLKIIDGFNYISNINFSEITSITKSLTGTPVEVIVIDKFNNGHRIARLNPNQRFSKYRKYLVPNQMCGRTCLHVICKISQQEVISNATDELMITNEEALISLAKGINNIYYKEQTEAGANYILSALSVLEKEKREEESPNEFPIQVDVDSYSDLPNALRYHS